MRDDRPEDHKSRTFKGTVQHPTDKTLRSFVVRFQWIFVLTGERRIAAEILGIMLGFHKDWKKQPSQHVDDRHCWVSLSTHALARFTCSSDTRVKEAMKYLKDVNLLKVHTPTASNGRSLRKHIALNVEKMNAAVAWINTNGIPCACIPGPDNDSVFVAYLGKKYRDIEEVVEI